MILQRAGRRRDRSHSKTTDIVSEEMEECKALRALSSNQLKRAAREIASRVNHATRLFIGAR